MVIEPQQLSFAVIKELSKFAGHTNEVLEHAAETAAAHAVMELNADSPSRSGRYARSWAQKKGAFAKVGGIRTVIIHNKKHYQLTHLLEHGHRKVVYGHDTGGTVAARVHIAPVETDVIHEFEELVKEGIRNASK